MSLFALIIAMGSALSSGGMVSVFIGLSSLALYAVSFFEAFKIRREMVMGKEVKDAIPNIKGIGGNKTMVIVIIALFAAAIGINILTALPWYAWLVLGIVAICYAPFLGKRARTSSKNNDADDAK